MKETPLDEREGLASGSSLGRALACHGSHALGKIFHEPPPKDFTMAGTRIADLIHKLETGEDLPVNTDDEELETAKFLLSKKVTKFGEICEEHDLDPDDFQMIHEQRFWYTHGGRALYSGQLDTGAVHKSKPIGVVIDDKSGWMPQPPPWQNTQLRSYGLLLLQNFPVFTGKDVQIHAATNSRFWDRKTTLEYDNLNELHKEVTTVLPAVLDSPPWAMGLNPGEHCRWCPARAQCPVLRFGMAKFEGEFGPPKIDIKAKAQRMTIPEIEDALVIANVIKNAVKAITDEAERRIQEEPDAFQFFEWKAGPPRRQVGDLGAAVAALAQHGITPEEIIECLRPDALTAGKTGKLEKLLYKKLNLDPDAKVTHPQTFEILTETLEAADAIRLTEPSPRLVYNPEKALPDKEEA